MRRAARRVLRVPDEVLGLLSEEARRVAERLDLSGDERLKAIIEDLYWRAGLSSRQVATLLGVEDRLLRRMMVRLRVERRGRVEALRARLTRYAKKPFTGSPAERVRIHALIAGDAHVRPHRAQVEVTTSTPNPWLIQLIHDLLRPYTEHFRLDPIYNRDTGYFEWRVGMLLDPSFHFLLKPLELDLADDEQFWCFMASFFEAEGAVKFSRSDRGGARVTVEVSGEDKRLIEAAEQGLRMRGFNARLFVKDEAGKRTNVGAVSRPCLVVGVYDEAHVHRLLEALLPLLDHYERRTYVRLALKALEGGYTWSQLLVNKALLDRVFESLIEYSRLKAKEEYLRRRKGLSST